MVSGEFYYIKDEFYLALPDCGLMTNKPDDHNGEHGRPCHYCLELDGYYWMVPISSQIGKYEQIYNDKIERRGFYDGIRFGFVNGERRAFLIQNTFPVSKNYIDKPYMVSNGTVHVKANERLSKELNKLIRKVYRLHKKGIKITLTNITKILSYLKEQES